MEGRRTHKMCVHSLDSINRFVYNVCSNISDRAHTNTFLLAIVHNIITARCGWHENSKRLICHAAAALHRLSPPHPRMVGGKWRKTNFRFWLFTFRRLYFRWTMRAIHRLEYCCECSATAWARVAISHSRCIPNEYIGKDLPVVEHGLDYCIIAINWWATFCCELLLYAK